jgi:N6-adenosine-specific RNA methylase IME4
MLLRTQAPARVLLVDPPWSFSDQLPGDGRGAAKNYRVLSVEQIMRFPLPAFEPDAILFLWRVASMPQEALDVVRCWGFRVKSEIIWQKLTKTGKPWIGMGHYVRSSHESCLVATRGRFKVADRSVRSRFEARVPVDDKGEYIHSAKPPEMYEIVEKLSGRGPYVELFSRGFRPGWTSFGDQLPGMKPQTETPSTQGTP